MADGTAHGPSGAGLPGWLVAVVLLLALVVLAVVLLLLVRPERRAGQGRHTSRAVDEEGLSAQDYRRRAAASADRADWDAVLLDSYRALATSAVERTLLVELPGRTAHEVAAALAVVFPEHRDHLARAASAFDDVRYGHLTASREQAADVAELDRTVLHTRPRLDTVAPS